MMILILNISVLLPLWLAADAALAGEPLRLTSIHYAAAGLLVLNGLAVLVRGLGWPRSVDELLFGPESEPRWGREQLAEWTADAMYAAVQYPEQIPKKADGYIDYEEAWRYASEFIDNQIEQGNLPRCLAAQPENTHA